MIIPSIDLLNGKAVQLVNGQVEKKRMEIDDVYTLAEKLSAIGPINVIDLDAAFGTGSHKTLIKKLAKKYRIRVGGGIRTVAIAREYIRAGVEKVIVGSRMFRQGKVDFGFLNSLEQAIGREFIILALDTKEGSIVINGWREKTSYKAENLLQQIEPYCSAILYTCVEREGMMRGTDLAALKHLVAKTKLSIIAAGGIASFNEIKSLNSLGVSAVLGMALYTGKIVLD
ncbi:MAG: HisA/HisF-related TIM barrel protein [Waddliaceae bacterium]